MDINIGIEEKHRIETAESLKRLLADSYTLYLMTHNYHWNVTGPQFHDLHTLFEGHYTELAIAVDDIAERIRSLGIFAPGTYSQFARLTSLETADEIPDATKMVKDLKNAHETLVRTCRQALSVAQSAEDESSAALISDRMRVHEKTAWMLRSML